MPALASQTVKGTIPKRKAPTANKVNPYLEPLNDIHHRVTEGVLHLENGIYFNQSNLLSKPQLAGALRVDIRTLQRISKSTKKPLLPFQAEGLVFFEIAMAKAVALFRSLEAAQNWFLRPASALGYKKPIEFMGSSFGAQSVIDLLGQIEHGVHV